MGRLPWGRGGWHNEAPERGRPWAAYVPRIEGI